MNDRCRHAVQTDGGTELGLRPTATRDPFEGPVFFEGGTEGNSVADVLFGDFPPTGKHGHSWPRSMAQIPIDVGDEPYEPLFPQGFGLSYR